MSERSAIEIYNDIAKVTDGRRFTQAYFALSEEEKAAFAKNYFADLTKAVVYELETQGFCPLMDELIELGKDVPVIVYAVFLELSAYYQTNAASDIRNTEYVPYLPKRFFWEDRNLFTGIVRGKETALPVAKNIRKWGRSAHLIAVKAQKEADPSQKAEEIIESASNGAQTIIAEAKKQADVIISEARASAEEELEKARTEAGVLIARAEEEASARADACAETVARKLVKKHIAAEQAAFRTECNEEIEALNIKYRNSVASAEINHDEMCEKTNEYQRTFVNSIDGMVAELSAMKAGFYEHLHKWQVDLYPKDVRPIAERFLELYKLIKVDGIINEQILFCEAGESEKIPVESAENALPVSSAEKTIQGLNKLNKNLNTFLHRYEASLSSLGLYAYYPKAGEIFDDIWHICDENDDCEGKPVAACVAPGIAKKAFDAEEDDVIIPAIVTVAE